MKQFIKGALKRRASKEEQTSGEMRGDLDCKNKEHYTSSVYDKDDLKILLLGDIRTGWHHATPCKLM